MEQYKIDRINELAKKKKNEGLTAEETEEQKLLREQYIADIKANLTSTIENTEFKFPDGSTKIFKKK